MEKRLRIWMATGLFIPKKSNEFVNHPPQSIALGIFGNVYTDNSYYENFFIHKIPSYDVNDDSRVLCILCKLIKDNSKLITIRNTYGSLTVSPNPFPLHILRSYSLIPSLSSPLSSFYLFVSYLSTLLPLTQSPHTQHTTTLLSRHHSTQHDHNTPLHYYHIMLSYYIRIHTIPFYTTTILFTSLFYNVRCAIVLFVSYFFFII